MAGKLMQYGILSRAPVCVNMANSQTSFYLESDVEIWRRTLQHYGNVLKLKAEREKKDKAKKLLELDSWFQTQLPRDINKRSERFLTLEELTKLMEWKLTRGKFRPRLNQLVQTNSSEFVKDVTTKAFKCLPDIQSAINEATKLKAVGPATASAILCAGSPDIPFMADEAMQAIPGLGKIDYTLKYYLQYLEKIQNCVKNLTKKDAQEDWNAHKVELCLWTHVMGLKYAPELFENNSSLKRKADAVSKKGQANDKGTKKSKAGKH